MLYQTWCPDQALPTVERSIALGVFDGVHIGHRAVISAARNVKPTPTSSAPTVTVFSLVGVPKSGKKLLTDEQEKAQAATLGVDEWLCVPFDTVRTLSPEAFVNDILHERLHARVVCCGYDFRFGRNGAGDADTLRRLCEPLGMEVRVVPVVEREGEPVSSTAVRRALQEGDPAKAMHLLGRPYTVEFAVQAGEHRGSDWGVPTINQPFCEEYLCPRFGVYASLVVLEGRQYRAITNIGTHPTVGGTPMPQAETHILDYQGNLYGERPAVQLIRFLREERRFGSAEALRGQIAADITKAAALLDGCDGQKAILFDFDDTLQHRLQAFYGAARELLARYSLGLSEEDYDRYARWMVKENNGGYVDYDAYAKKVCKRLSWPITPQELLWELTHRFPFHSVLLPHAKDVLAELRRRGYRLGIITNGNSMMQQLKLDFVGIRPWVDVVLVGGTEDVHKPKAEVFRRAAQRLCVSPENCVYVGDYPPNDIVGAQSAGMTPLYIDVHGRRECPEGVDAVTALPQLLECFK